MLYLKNLQKVSPTHIFFKFYTLLFLQKVTQKQVQRIFKKNIIGLSEQSPIGLGFAQSGHPGQDTNLCVYQYSQCLVADGSQFRKASAFYSSEAKSSRHQDGLTDHVNELFYV
jgi:hypothetical protein